MFCPWYKVSSERWVANTDPGSSVTTIQLHSFGHLLSATTLVESVWDFLSILVFMTFFFKVGC